MFAAYTFFVVFVYLMKLSFKCAVDDTVEVCSFFTLFSVSFVELK
ncbi:hypothetical protein HMPREF9141_1207 [Prevotella multiformis DSM 16608]|uniref:Uncharacterized protein n=1 Tax=Prevotella multiformis DSM 16608 TaxID=888743 RepID=F0F6I5_9BACT|nr:hypothetical protein HMPREF9141_1207 [Prevotella multiformis DSM 16608]